MNPSQNAIEVVKILWRDARIEGTTGSWRRCVDQLGGIRLFLCVPPDEQQCADYLYVCDMQDEAIYMVSEAK